MQQSMKKPKIKYSREKYSYGIGEKEIVVESRQIHSMCVWKV